MGRGGEPPRQTSRWGCRRGDRGSQRDSGIPAGAPNAFCVSGDRPVRPPHDHPLPSAVLRGERPADKVRADKAITARGGLVAHRAASGRCQNPAKKNLQIFMKVTQNSMSSFRSVRAPKARPFLPSLSLNLFVCQGTPRCEPPCRDYQGRISPPLMEPFGGSGLQFRILSLSSKPEGILTSPFSIKTRHFQGLKHLWDPVAARRCRARGF